MNRFGTRQTTRPREISGDSKNAPRQKLPARVMPRATPGKTMRAALFFMLAAVPLAVYAGSYNFTYIKEIILSISFLPLLFAFVRAKGARISHASLAALSVPVWMAVSFFFSRYQGTAVPALCAGFTVFFIFMVAANQAAVNGGSLRLIILLSALPVIAAGFGQVFFPGLFKVMLAFGGRIPSTFGNPNFFGAYLVCITPFILSFSGRLGRNKYPYTALMLVPVLFLLFMTGSKGAIAALACSMAVYAWLTYSKQGGLKENVGRNALPLATAAVAAAIAVIMLFHNIDSLKFRFNVWPGAIRLAAANPVFGSGPGSFSYAFPSFKPEEIMKRSYMHSYEVSYPENIFLQVAAEHGFAGLGVLIFMLWIILGKPDRGKIDFYAAFCGLLAANMAGVDINYAVSAMLAAVLSGELMNGRQGGFIEIDRAWKKAALTAAGAAAVFILVIQLNIHLSDIYLSRATALSGAGQWQASIENYKRALRYNPHNVPAGYFLASAYYDSDPATNAPAALSAMEEVEKTAPDYVLLHYKKGVILNAMGDTDAAIGEYGKMLKMDPYLKPALTDLAYIYYKKGDLFPAEEYMKKAAETAGDDPALYNNLGNIYFMQKRVNEAVAAYKKAIEIKPDKDYYYNLGCVYFTLNDIANARENIHKAAELDAKSGGKEAKIVNMEKMIKQYERVIKK